MIDISALGARKIRAGHYQVPHGGDTYDIRKTHANVWCLTKNGEYVADFSTKTKATFYAWWFIQEAQEAS